VLYILYKANHSLIEIGYKQALYGTAKEPYYIGQVPLKLRESHWPGNAS